MKRTFSTHWNSSKQPRKQRKYRAKAPLHIARKMLATNLSEELRKKYGKRNLVLRKGDMVKIMRGRFKKKQGKIIEVNTKKKIVKIEGIQKKKADGSNVSISLKPSKLQIIELNTDDKKRIKMENKKQKEGNKTKDKVNKAKEEKK